MDGDPIRSIDPTSIYEATYQLCQTWIPILAFVILIYVALKVFLFLIVTITDETDDSEKLKNDEMPEKPKRAFVRIGDDGEMIFEDE